MTVRIAPLTKSLAVALSCTLAIGGCASTQTPSPPSPLQPATDTDGQEALAYSYALQAYLYTYPLFIADREIKRREKLSQPIKTAPIAPINRLGHMATLATAKSDMPYSPNNDTVYTGVALDLTAEPIVLAMPEIKDRYAVVQVTNAYVENKPYVYSPGANENNAEDLVFVGPDWTGDLPDDLTPVQLDTNVAFLAIRIALSGEDELPIVRAYQDLMSLTSLSDWVKGDFDAEPPIPAPRERQSYDGPFAQFHKAADLLTAFPAPERHRAMNASLWRVGLAPGQKFNPDVLAPATREGVRRALEDAPEVIDYLRRNRGKRFPTGWDAGRYADNIVFDYAARAAMSLVGLMGNDPEEAIYFYTYFDAEREALNGSNAYKIHLSADETPDINPLGFWSVTMYDGVTFKYVENPIDRYRLGSSSDLKWNEDGSLDIWIQPDAPTDDKLANWLPSPPNRPFRITFRIYSPTPEMVDEFYKIELALPPLERITQN